jgi:Xaa-Pro aminopeptidase
MIKLPGEIALMKNAVQTTGLAFDRVLRTIKPGMKEYEVEAELTYMPTPPGMLSCF